MILSLFYSFATTINYKVELPFVETESRNRGPHVGRHGDMPIPTGQRRKLKKYKRRS